MRQPGLQPGTAGAAWERLVSTGPSLHWCRASGLTWFLGPPNRPPPSLPRHPPPRHPPGEAGGEETIPNASPSSPLQGLLEGTRRKKKKEGCRGQLPSAPGPQTNGIRHPDSWNRPEIWKLKSSRNWREPGILEPQNLRPQILTATCHSILGRSRLEMLLETTCPNSFQTPQTQNGDSPILVPPTS